MMLPKREFGRIEMERGYEGGRGGVCISSDCSDFFGCTGT